MAAERERLELLQAKADEIAASLPVWDGEMPAVLVNIVDPVTRQLLGHRFVTASIQPGRKHLRLVGEAS
jgi:NAD(P)H-dependent FMN reductase